MRLNPEKTKLTLVSQSRNIAPSYDGLTFGSAELEEVNSLHILRITSDFKLMFETHLWEVKSKAARSLGVVRRAGMLFDCPRVL